MTLRSVLGVALVLLLLAGGGLLSTSAHPISSALPAPRESSAAPSVSASLHAAPAAAAHALARSVGGAAPSAAPAPATSCGGTPSGAYNWNSQNFFTDVSTTFWVPGSPSLSGSNFQPVPCTNIIPTYTNGFYLNVTTNVPITTAEMTIWGTGWPTPSNSLPDLKGFAPENPTVLPMYIQPPFYRTASFFFNDYRNFWPGSTVYFNVTLSSANATPSTIYSASPFSNHWEKYQWNGGVDNATWSFYVASPFSEQPVGQNAVNFSNIISVYSSPSVLSVPAFDPNPHQPLNLSIASLNFTGAGAPAIPMAQAQFTLTGGITGVYYANFGPANHSVMQLTQPLGPYPGTTVTFNITLWLPWEGGGIDYVYSSFYSFNWSANGGWWNPTGGLEGNLQFTTFPDLTVLGANPSLSTGTPVNVSIHEPIQNVTISSSTLHYRYADSNGVNYGALPMRAAGPNTSYAVIPGLPPGGGVQFSVVAKDIYGNAISSGNYSYTESGPVGPNLGAGYGSFYFEAIDVATGLLVPSLNFTIANDTWSESSVGYAYGFGNPMLVGGHSALAVAFGNYIVTVRAFGVSQTWKGAVSDQNPFVVLFYVSSQALSPTFSSTLAALSAPGIVGLAAASVAAWPVAKWFQERRRKAEAEQRRITL